MGPYGFTNGLLDVQNGLLGVGPFQGVGSKKSNDHKGGKRIASRLGLDKSLKRVWQVKRNVNVLFALGISGVSAISGVSVSTPSSSMSALLPPSMVCLPPASLLVVCQTLL